MHPRRVEFHLEETPVAHAPPATNMTVGEEQTVARVVLAIAGVCAASMLVTGCQNAEPLPQKDPMKAATVTMLLNPTNEQDVLVTEIYKTVLESKGRSVILRQDPTMNPASRIDDAMNGAGNFWVGCTGNMLNTFNPDAAQALEKEYVADKKKPSGRDFLAETHVALMASLPTDLVTVDPSSVIGCEGRETTVLPQNLVAVFNANLFDREDRTSVANLTKFLSQEDIDELFEESKTSGNPQKTVAEWVRNNIADAGASGNADSADSNKDSSSSKDGAESGTGGQ